MPDRAAGYVTDVGYTFGYHPALNPLAARLPFLRAGLEPPRVATACELGFGQGVSLAVHAAAGPVRWWGNDLLPGHVASARTLTAAAGADARLFAESFAEFAARADLPPFDFVGLHGVLSWVSAENRAVIAGFLRERLAPGGVVYTGCNALAGWAELLPLRAVLAEHAARAGDGDTPARIERALGFAARLLDTHPAALRALPGVAARFERLRTGDRRYLAHEYFNRDWRPFAFAELAELLGSAGLSHAGSAQLRDHLDDFSLTGDQRRLLAEVTDDRLRETVREFLTAPAVRRDYWVREARPLEAAARAAAWRATRLVLALPRADVPERVTGPLGEQRLDGAAHAAVLDALADHRPRTLGEIGVATGLGPEALADAAFELAAFDIVAVAQDDATIAACAPRAARLNAHLDARAVVDGDIAVRASPVTGGGIERRGAALLAAPGLRMPATAGRAAPGRR